MHCATVGSPARLARSRFNSASRRMFEELRAEGSRAMFGHLLSPEHATEGMLGDAVGGLPRVGTAATITDIREHPEGGLVVAYEGVRRFQASIAGCDAVR